ncbi:MAG TPA: hypothetical protein VFI93_10030 [Rhizomicrobium sp.]|jgi:hypothetical protein|nr:hypothetical protein [Rhizomicrobium sp.]
MSLNTEDTKPKPSLGTQDARQGHTGDGARYVLAISVGLSVAAGVVLALIFFA